MLDQTLVRMSARRASGYSHKMHKWALTKLRLVAERWRSLSLSRQYMVASAAVLVPGMLVIGNWVSNEIAQGVSELTASSTALYMDSFVAPLVQELATRQELSPEAHAGLQRLMKNTSIGRRVVSINIWSRDGVVVYSSHPSIIGKHYAVAKNFKRALRGAVTAEIEPLEDSEDKLERSPVDQPFLEMYSPIREKGTGRIIAVGEFYVGAVRMKQELLRSKLKSWALVGAVTVVMFLLL